MLIKRKRAWELPEAAATDASAFYNRREFARLFAAGSVAAATASVPFANPANAAEAVGPPEGDPTAGMYPFERNGAYTLDRPLSQEKLVSTYNNYYEFGSSKTIWRKARGMPVRPWTVQIDGMVEQEKTVDIDDLIKRMPLEERLYRHRCVEAWSINVPWSGFPMAALVDFARPLGSAKYVRMETFVDKDVASGQRASWYPWPYVEGLTIEEATNELAFMATGAYGHPLPQQNGAPLRLAVPWKYGFKSAKGLVRFTFTDQEPLTFWHEVQGNEYGFWANVNPEVDHPRWSQASEKFLQSTDDIGFGASPKEVPTQKFNGYGEQVAQLYKGLEEKYGVTLWR
ncbi:MAG: protein-methionine-sulfoxide reductase catalytic subunit MsrP [Rhodovibrio sp.]|nr:protein-methionine-sulfoxide reductase catalytic subunit MsrP [Rhodovibrio sp.]